MMRRSKAKGLTRTEVLIVVLMGGLVLALVPVVFWRAKTDAARTVCAANLATIGKAMLTYAHDYGGQFPRAGGRNTTWAEAVQWDAPDRQQAYGLALDGTGGTATISSCFYLLVKYLGLRPKDFICPGDKGTSEFQLAELTGLREGFALPDAWDFGPQAWRHCSYAYHLPFGLYALTTSHDPGMPLAADRNPWLRSPAADPKPLSCFRPDLPPWKGKPEEGRAGNSISHAEDGQNVLFVDGHVTFEPRSYCGSDQDNIYMVSNNLTGASPVGTIPVPPAVTPANRKDAVLVHDPPRQMAMPLAAPNVDSSSLKQTVVVATLNCPLPEHKNAIWCATFQMAWDKLKQDIIGEPIQVPAARELADRLNRSPFPTKDIEDKSYYAAAGFVKNGILEQIQKEMKRRFPAEPMPTFDSRYKPDVALAYAYLNVGVEFARPYYACPTAFDFRDSSGTRTGVTAFRGQTGAQGSSYDPVRAQVEVLYHNFGQSPDAEQFAVDLSRRTQPYQVVLACLPRGATLGETANLLQERVAEFQNRPDHKIRAELRPIDTLIVPDVLYKLTHHFEELIGKALGNPRWPETLIFEALQKIDFSLSRTGVVLKSEARVAIATRGVSSAEEQRPRHFHFDRPFLICVRKREPNATPFFLMWVDNAELMKPYENGDKKG